jgi:acyl carrier protein
MSNINAVREFVVENYLFGDGDSLKEETSFLEEGIVDSTGILELVMFLEETFDIKIEDDELVPENMDSLQNIARFLEQKFSGASTADV